MIIQLRIDDRLIHGEVIALWLNYTSADVVMVADDKTANDNMLRMAMKLAQPQGVAMPIMTIDEAIDALNKKGDGPKKILVVTKDAQNARKLAEGVASIKEVNVGAMRASEGKRQATLKVFLDDRDIEDLRAIEAAGKRVYQQTKPDIKALTLEELIAKAK